MGAEPISSKRRSTRRSSSLMANGTSKRRLTEVSLQSLALQEWQIPEDDGKGLIIEGSDDGSIDKPTKEGLDTRKSPWFSLWLGNAIQWNCGVQFSIYMMSMWPYLHKLDTSADVTFLGWIIASYSVGQAVASPVFGIWNQRTMSTKWPVAVGLIATILGNLLYAALPTIPQGPWIKWIMLVARFVIGIGSGNYAVLRSYTASASVPKDRVKAIALATGSYVLGITIGPAIQMCFTPIGQGFTIANVIKMNMFTLPALVMVLINIIALILLFLAFKEDYAGIISKEEKDARNKSDSYFVLPKPDKFAIGVCCYMFFIQNCVSTVMETLSSPITMALFNFNDQQTVLYSGIAQAIASGFELVWYALFAFTRLGKADNRILLLVGLFFFAVYHAIILPYPFYTEKLDYINITANPTEDTTDLGGCYNRFQWCKTLPRVPLIAYYAGYIIGIGVGFPYIGSPTGTLYSEVIGPRNQGNLQGIMALLGSIARVIAPILSTALFESSGYTWPMVIELGVLLVGALSIIIFWKRLVPLKVIPKNGETLTYKNGVFSKF